MDYQSYFDRPPHKRSHDALVRELAPFKFSEDLVWSLYHRLNGREALAETYLNVFLAEQEAMRKQMVVEPEAVLEPEPEAEPEARGFEESKEESIECIECPSTTPISPP